MVRFTIALGALLLLAASALAVPTSAQEATLSIDSQEAEPGAVLEIPIEVENFTGIGSLSLIINYDPASLSFPEDAETDKLIARAPTDDFIANVPEPGELRISWFDSTGGQDPIDIERGTLLFLTFSEFTGGDVEITFSNHSEITDIRAETISTTFEGGIVSEMRSH